MFFFFFFLSGSACYPGTGQWGFTHFSTACRSRPSGPFVSILHFALFLLSALVFVELILFLDFCTVQFLCSPSCASFLCKLFHLFLFRDWSAIWQNLRFVRTQLAQVQFKACSTFSFQNNKKFWRGHTFMAILRGIYNPKQSLVDWSIWWWPYQMLHFNSNSLDISESNILS